ncbi:MAG: DUF11 domain-containing protein [Pseudorhodobacter sp.]|nr:MAG: DUF11 domain-containing protein [Pseudorhodobacter sp.]
MTNQAAASGSNPGGSPVSDTSDDDSTTAGEDDPTVTPLTPTPKIELSKSASLVDVNGNGRADAGDRIDYAFAVENTGAATLTNISVSDTLAGVSISGTIASLAPGATDSTSITGSYTITLADMNAGQVENQATVSGNPPTGPAVTDQSDDPANTTNTPDADGDPGDPTVFTLIPVNGLSIDKRLAAGSITSYDAVGDEIDYEFVVTNTGNVTLTGPFVVNDPLILSGTTCPAGALNPGQSAICTGTHVVTQANLDAGSFVNTATVFEDKPGSQVSESDPDSQTVPAVQTPALTMVKATTEDQPEDFQPNNIIDYTYVVTNSGNVTITDPITVSDNRIPAVSCPALPPGGLAPQASISCTGAYQITAADISARQVTNIATATDGTTTSNTADFTIPQGGTPGLSIEKSLTSVNGNAVTAFTAVGDQLFYSYTVRNTGNTAYAADVVIHDDKFPSPLVCFDSQGGTQAFPSYAFDPVGGEVTCTTPVPYVVTQDDVNANKVVNVATAASTFGASTPVTSLPDTVTVPGTPANSLSVVKTANPASGAGVGDTITYTIAVTNTGNQTLSGVSVTDDKVAALTCDIDAPVTLAPNAVLTCQGPYVVTQEDVDNELIENRADASGMPPQGGVPVTAFGEADHVPEAPNPAVSLLKSGVFNDLNSNGRADAGETISYSFAVTNSGNQTLNDIQVTDPNLTPFVVGTITSLAPGASQTLTASYPLTQADIDAGSGEVANTATVTAEDPQDQPLTPVTDDTTITLPRAPGISLVKTGTLADTNGNGRDDAGDIITYAFTVTNTGNVTLTGVTLSDTSFPGLVVSGGPIASLAPGQSNSTTFSASFTLTDAAMNGAYADPADPATVQNAATVTGTYQGPLGPVTVQGSDEVNVAITPEPGVTISKSADTSGLSTPPQAGEVISYSFTLENTGNVTLTDVSVTDTLAGLVLSGSPVTLAPGEVNTTAYTATYTLTHDDLDAGEVVNLASVSALPPNTLTPIDDSDGATVTLASDGEITVVKSASAALSTPAAAGDVVSYTITVTNTGTKRLTNVVISDPLLGLDEVAVGTGTLLPGEAVVLTAPALPTYALTQADINRGYVDNQATAEAVQIVNGVAQPVTDRSDDTANPTGDNDPTRVTLPADPGISLLKTGSFADTNGNGRADVGERVTYSFTVTNEGNVTLTNITLTDPLPGIVLAGGLIASLEPGETDSTTFTGHVVLTQAMITAGHVDNRATVSADTPAGGTVEDDSHPTLDDADADTVVTLPQAPRLALVKTGTFADANSNGRADAGEIVTYDFRVTNTGNVPVTGITVTDTGIAGLTVTGGPVDLAPGASSAVGAFTASYTITQTDVNAGTVSNTATTSGTDPNSAAVTDSSHPSSTAPGATAPTLVTLPRVPALTMDKTSPLGAPVYQEGEVIGYQFVVTNTGNTTIPGPITINDNMIGAIDCGTFPGGGAPGAVLTCTANYTITENDDLFGSVFNNARATDGITQSPTSDEIVPASATPALSIDKVLLSVNGDTGLTAFTTAGDVLRYRFTVTNTGGTSFPSNVYVTDTVISPGIGDILCWDYATLGAFNVGEVATCEAEYEVTQTDLDRTSVTNEAIASAVYAPTSPSPLTVQSPVDRVTVNSDIDPGISLVKSSDPAFGAGLGETITYTLLVTNTGNQTLSGVTVSDTRVDDLTCSETAPVTLSPDATMTCTGTYVVTQDDLDTETIPNTADVTSTSPQGAVITATDSYDHTPEAQDPAISLTKTASAYNDANGNGRPDLGETITYTFVVTNSGNQTLNTISLTDPNLTVPTVVTIAALVPGESRTYNRTYAITQDDLDATTGDKSNTATVTAKDPDGVDLAPVPATATTPLPRAPQLTLVKTASFVEQMAPAGEQNIGDRIDYTITVTNAGNVAVTDIDVEDVLLGGVLTTIPSLDPGQSQVVTGSHVLIAGDLNAGEVLNTATASGTGSNGTTTIPVEAEDDVTVTLTRAPRIALIKTATFNDVDGSNAASAGDTVTYQYSVQNMGNVTAYGVRVSENAGDFTGTGPLPSPAYQSGGSNVVGETADLDAGATAIWTATYTLTAADIAAGGVTNQATAAGEDPTGAPVTDASDESGTGTGDNDPTALTYNRAPVAVNDASSNNQIGQPVTINPLVANGGAADSDPDGTLVASSVRLLDGTNPVTSLVVAGQGTWTVNTTTGAITFTPFVTFTGDPDQVSYTVADNDGATSAPATVTIDYTTAPVANDDSSSNNAVGSTVSVAVTGNDTKDGDQTIALASVRIMDGATPVTSLTVAGEGVWTVNTTTGAISFAPFAGFTGDPTQISYRFADNQGNLSNTAVVTIDYTDVPVADPDSSSGNAIGSTVSLAVTGNDRVDGDQTINLGSVRIMDGTTPVTSLTVAGEGVWTVNTTTGAISFAPFASFTTNPTPIGYRFADNQGNLSNTASVTITYTGAPVADDDISSDNAIGSTVSIDVTGNDEVDPSQTIDLASVRIMDGATPVTSLTVPGEGIWRVDSASGEISFEPEPGFTGDPAQISYTFADLQGNVSNPATVTINYTAVPVADPDESLLNAINATVTVDVLDNDSVDPNRLIEPGSVQLTLTGAPGTATLSADGKTLTVPDEGVWTVNPDGTISFDPEEGFTTNPTPVSYTFEDNQGNLSTEATITITYTGAPVATDDLSQDNPFGLPVTVSVFDNDTVAGSEDFDPASVRIMDGATPVTSLLVDGEGTWTVNPDGTITFTPVAGFTGNPAAIDYRFADTQGNLSNIAGVEVNYTVPPVATANESLLNPIGLPVVIQVFADDTASPGRTLVPTSLVLMDGATPVTSLTVDGEGAWTVDTTTGEITFTPEPGYEGQPSPVNYRVADDQGNLSNLAALTVTFTARPVAIEDASADNPIGQAVTLDVLADDTVAPGRTIVPTSVRLMDGTNPVTSLTVPGEGVWTVDPASGAITFTPENGFTTDPTPVSYTFEDDQGNVSNLASVTVLYTAAPEATDNASDDNPVGQPVVVDVLADDSVAAGRSIDPTSVRLMDGANPVTSLTVPGEGVWTVDPASGAITFTPEAGFIDAPTPVRYRFADDQGNLSNTATVSVSFTTPPVAADDNGEYIPGNSVTIAALDDDSSPSGRPLDPASVQIVGTAGPGQPLVVAGEGTWSVDTTTGNIIFTPEPGYTGDPTPIRYTVADDQGNRSNEATVTVVSAGIPEVDLVIAVAATEDTNGDGIFGAGDTVFWSFTITNTGNVPLFSASIINPSLNMPGLSCSLPPEYAQTGLLPGQSVQLVCQRNGYRVTGEDVAAGQITLSATVAANDQVGQTASASTSAAALPVAPGGVAIEKTAALRNVRVGQLVPYTITVTNRSTVLPVMVNVTDTLPEGLIYRTGTGAVAGAAQEPVVTGQRLGFNGVAVPAGGAVEITLSAYVTQSARPGEKVNTAQAFSPVTGLPISAKATASVMLGADPVFDCGTVIGRVFDDANQDGYMDGPVAYRELTDDSYVADKFSVRPEPRKEKNGEPGIPGVRLVTAQGTIITTDEFGRFHVPCAELPSAIGQNFLLKLDERTLPTGYRMTTENPRVMRLTAGKMSEMNFGAAISKLVRIELSDAAFLDAGKGITPRPELKAGLKQLLGQIAETPSSLRMTYKVGPDGEAKAKARLKAVEAMIRDLWRDTGRYKLNVEKELKR